MTINLPPRRKLPADVKERMRPDFAGGVRHRRNHIPLAVAAGVVLLIAGGVAASQSITDHTPQPGHDRVVAPSSRDLDRCRAALNDQTWSSTEMVVFEGRKVLVGQDNRFCELSRSRAYVGAPNAPVVGLEAGSITYRSEHIVAGVPPLGAQHARARQSNGTYSRGSTDAVVTGGLFVVLASAPLNITELVFDDRTVPVPLDAELPLASTTDSYESGDSDPREPVNVLARCADNGLAEAMKPADLEGWQPLLSTGLERREGLLVAHRAHQEWATCTVVGSGGEPGPLRKLHPRADPAGAQIQSSFYTGDEFVFLARTHPSATTVEIGPEYAPVTVEVVDGFFAARVSNAIGNIEPTPARVTIVARNADKEVVYAGGLQ